MKRTTEAVLRGELDQATAEVARAKARVDDAQGGVKAALAKKAEADSTRLAAEGRRDRAKAALAAYLGTETLDLPETPEPQTEGTGS